MAIVIESPNEIYSVANHNARTLFLAGGITNVPDWQSTVVDALNQYENLTIYNPRRKDFFNAKEEEQIVWEFTHLNKSDILLFWFAKETVCPITLYELGKWVNSTNKTAIIGIDPEYTRKKDIIIQTKLARPDIDYFCETIEDLIFETEKKLNFIQMYAYPTTNHEAVV
jgi:hypothetical protein